MTHARKTFGFALIAVLVTGALAVPPALAGDKFTGPEAEVPVVAKGTVSVFAFTTAQDTVSCSSDLLSGTLVNGTEKLTLHPEFAGTQAERSSEHCNSTLGNTAIVDVNGCDYRLTGATTGSDNGTDAIIWIECEKAGEHIVITTGLGCKIKIPAQTPTSGGVAYTNNAGKVQIKATLTGVTYTSEGIACAIGGVPSEANDADYEGTFLLESVVSGKSISVS